MSEWRKSVHYWWSYVLFSPECKELTSMLDPLLYRWGVPPVVIRCVHWTMQMGLLLTWIMAQSTAIVMPQQISDASVVTGVSLVTDDTRGAAVYSLELGLVLLEVWVPDGWAIIRSGPDQGKIRSGLSVSGTSCQWTWNDKMTYPKSLDPFCAVTGWIGRKKALSCIIHIPTCVGSSIAGFSWSQDHNDKTTRMIRRPQVVTS